MIEELKADPDYAEVYSQMALDDIYEEGGVAAYLTALRCVLPVQQ
ncbi:hypothetical protein [Pantoea sp. BAV 3049]|nr:hypothetical protein [Pantoea sp. BAV 3049]